MADKPSRKIKRKGIDDPVTITVFIERELRDELRDVCDERGIVVQAFIRRAIMLMLKKVRGM